MAGNDDNTRIPNDLTHETLTPSQEDKLLEGSEMDVDAQTGPQTKSTDATNGELTTVDASILSIEEKPGTSVTGRQSIDEKPILDPKKPLILGAKPANQEKKFELRKATLILPTQNKTEATNEAENKLAPRKKLSGAAKRKLKKEKQIALKGPRENLLTPLMNSTPKRGRGTPGSETREAQPSKRTDTKNTSETYAQKLSKANLLLAIVDVAENNQLKKIEDEQYYKLLNAMQELYLKSIGSGKEFEGTPSFTENRNIRTAIKLQCTDSLARKWVEHYVPQIPTESLWEGANLAIIDFNRLPKPVTMNIWCPGLKGSNSEIFKLLNLCNPELDTSDWSVSRRKSSEKGVSLKVGISNNTKEFIQSKKNRLFFGIAQAICYFEKPKKGEKGQKENGDDIQPMFTDTETEHEAEAEDENSQLERTVVPAATENGASN